MFADVTFTTEGMVVIGGLLATLVGAIVYLDKQRMAAKDERLAEMKSYKEIANEAVLALEAKVNEERAAKGQNLTKIIAPVVPEHSSPVTMQQQDTADLQTIRARITAASLELGLPPREAAAPESKGSEAIALKKVVEAYIKKASDQVQAKTAEKVVEKLKQENPDAG